MKKVFSVILCLLILLTAAACGNTASTDETAESTETNGISIVTTVYPVYDWLNAITADTGCELSYLYNTGVDLHSYQPTAQDLVAISSADIFVYVGGESDEWVEDALESQSSNVTAINLMELLGGKAIEEQDELEAGEEEEEETAYDEHIWLSVKNASVLCSALCEKLSAVSPDNAEAYNTNTTAYVTKLDNLDKQYEAAVAKATNKTLVFGDRFPFLYLFNDYGLERYAAFSGCSAESEASFETVTKLAQKIDELKLDNILVIETSDGSLAQTIISNTASKDQKVLTLNSLQSAQDLNSDYITVMAQNLVTLSEAMGVK